MSATHDATAPAGNAHLDANAPNKDHDITSPSSTDVSLTGRDGIVQNGEKSVREAEAGANGAAAEPTAPGAQDGEHPQRTKLQIFLIMLSLAVAVLLVALDITIVTTALPTISAEFNSASGYTWIGSAYLIAQSAATPIWGKISDIFGRKNLLLICLCLLAGGDLVCGFARTKEQLFAFRAIAGIGGGGVNSVAMIIVSDITTLQNRGKFQGRGPSSRLLGGNIFKDPKKLTLENTQKKNKEPTTDPGEAAVIFGVAMLCIIFMTVLMVGIAWAFGATWSHFYDDIKPIVGDILPSVLVPGTSSSIARPVMSRDEL